MRTAAEHGVEDVDSAASEAEKGLVDHMAPSSRFALSLKPSVAYLPLNLYAPWKKQMTLPSP